MSVYESQKEKSRAKKRINSQLFNKLINWIEKRCRFEKREHAKCHFQEIVKLLGIDASDARSIVELAQEKGFLRPERYGDVEHYIVGGHNVLETNIVVL